MAQRRFVHHDLEEVAAHRRRPDHAHDVLVGAKQRVEGIEDGAEPRHVAHIDVVVDLGGMSDTASSRRWVPIFIATARAPTLLRICRARLSGTMPLGAASSTSAAVWAAASRSFSQFSRKFAIDGT